MVIDPRGDQQKVEVELEDDFWQRCRIETQDTRAAFRGIRPNDDEAVAKLTRRFEE
jgi:hypothetical protein